MGVRAKDNAEADDADESVEDVVDAGPREVDDVMDEKRLGGVAMGLGLDLGWRVVNLVSGRQNQQVSSLSHAPNPNHVLRRLLRLLSLLSDRVLRQ